MDIVTLLSDAPAALLGGGGAAGAGGMAAWLLKSHLRRREQETLELRGEVEALHTAVNGLRLELTAFGGRLDEVERINESVARQIEAVGDKIDRLGQQVSRLAGMLDVRFGPPANQ